MRREKTQWNCKKPRMQEGQRLSRSHGRSRSSEVITEVWKAGNAGCGRRLFMWDNSLFEAYEQGGTREGNFCNRLEHCVLQVVPECLEIWVSVREGPFETKQAEGRW